jgi:hypothetical protein
MDVLRESQQRDDPATVARTPCSAWSLRNASSHETHAPVRQVGSHCDGGRLPSLVVAVDLGSAEHECRLEIMTVPR